MEKQELTNIITESLKPLGYKKKGNYWIKNREEVNTMVNLQKSQYGNYLYINYGYILNSIPLDGLMMHIYKRVATTDKVENKLIHDLLNFEFDISDSDREEELKRILNQYLVIPITTIETETDILKELKEEPDLDMTPGSVRRHFNLL
ncbi:DUF4304 domain-containing protein [Chryseobacterium sp. MEBOG06]|uniref:DUF4304 domain-containing protein n=1 Tax=Chryseobacterium sp. MEBOG06 TaxID=2879938 RepID=UPI001F221FDB|nr:DUF4304 domain-containing protein [Chryseobacterium sp. MEBOG06]UKB82563.1 DUF4304 domain-containing protein [Chryseobacterium sp. MEBOG06]